jgi:hypothetical protein
MMKNIRLNHDKQFRYSVIHECGTEMRKFYTLKVAIAFAICEEAIILKRKARA